MPVSPDVGSRFRRQRIAFFFAVPVAAFPIAAWGQAGNPITITPRTLAPQQPQRDVHIEIPEGGAVRPPEGSEKLSAEIGEVEVVGGFAELAPLTAAIAARLRNGRHTLAEIYAAASEIEAVHARAGFVLARVSVPPQQLGGGGTLRIVVTDGFIEEVAVAGLPLRVRAPVRRATAKLVRRGHLRMQDIEQALVIAGNVSGLTLRSALARGQEAGGARLILEGSHDPLAVQATTSNAYDPSLGRYSVSAELSLNSLLGQGETIYGFIAGHYDVTRLFSESSPARIVGLGIVLAPGDRRFSLNPEMALSRTRPTPSPGVPQTVGKLRRLSLRASYALRQTRSESTGATLAVEQIEATSDAPDFGVRLSEDRYMAARLGLSWSRVSRSGASLAGSLRISQGLGSLGAISEAQSTASAIPYSRQGSSPDFTNVDVSASAVRPMGPFSIGIQARTQATFGKPQFRSEQFSMEGDDALSAYVGGVATVDEGAVARVELGPRVPISASKAGPLIRPYVFAAGGTGRIDRPTMLEPDSIRAAAAGAGISLTFLGPQLRANLEYARGMSDYAPLDRADRVSFSVSLRV